jgi:hypothetical protein
MFRLSVSDDRGRSVEWRDPMYRGSELGDKDRGRVNRSGTGVPPWVMYGAVVVVGVYHAISMTRLSLAAAALRLGFSLVFLCVVWWLILPHARRLLWIRSWKRRFVELGRCPACQYSMASLVAEADGCTVCPECGGAWRLGGSGHAGAREAR